MFSLKWDQTGNMLVLGYAGDVMPDDARRCAEEIRGQLAQLQPGFRLVVDLTELLSMDVSCSPLIANIMEMCNAAGVAEVFRIIPDPTRDIGLQILSFFHYGNEVYIRTFTSAVEAMEILAQEPA
jgi:ABC-type transporter Mla MlaB component